MHLPLRTSSKRKRHPDQNKGSKGNAMRFDNVFWTFWILNSFEQFSISPFNNAFWHKNARQSNNSLQSIQFLVKENLNSTMWYYPWWSTGGWLVYYTCTTRYQARKVFPFLSPIFLPKQHFELVSAIDYSPDNQPVFYSSVVVRFSANKEYTKNLASNYKCLKLVDSHFWPEVGFCLSGCIEHTTNWT